ncbi:MAG: helix-turn-helix transcriptional regulator [Pseudomonadota bacterium]
MPERIDQHLGKRIAEARERHGLSEKDLARKVELLPRQLIAFESGSVRIPAEVIARLSRELDVTPGWFYSGLPGQDAFDRTG